MDRFDDEPTDPNLHRPDQRQEVHGEQTGDDLVAVVYANVDDDEPRLVYGDYLLERGDSRGEFVQLQLARRASGAPPTDREVELFGLHVEAWTGPLFEAVVASSIRFERGFLARCKARDRTIALRDVVGHPMWLTVEQLISSDVELVTNPCLRSLTRIQTSAEALAALSGVEHATRLAHATVPFGEFGSYVIEREVLAWRRIFEVGALQQLRSLTLPGLIESGGSSTGELLASRLGRQLVELETMLGWRPLEPWVNILRGHPSLRRMTFRPGEAYADDPRAMPAVVFERVDGGDVRLTLEIDDAMYIGGLISSLHDLPPSYRIEVVTLDGGALSTAKLEELRFALGPQRAVLRRGEPQ